MTNARFSIIQSTAVADHNISNAQFRTLAALGIYGDKNGWCFPKLNTIGMMLGKSKQAVSKDIRHLFELGYLEIYPQKRADGGNTYNKYRLLFDTNRQPYVDTPSTPEVDTPSNPEVDALTSHYNAPNESKREGNSQDFDQLLEIVERYIGLPQGQQDMKAIQEMEKLNVVEEDIALAVKFFAEQGRAARGAAHILNSVKYNLTKRVQADKTKGVKSQKSKVDLSILERMKD
jgi:hypothetical protein